MKYFIGELIGTYILSSSLNFMADYTKGGKVNILEIVIGFLIAVQTSRKLSGAHLNPGVTLTFYLNSSPEEREKKLPMYKEMLLGQLAGGLLSPVLAKILLGQCLVLSTSDEANFFTAFTMEMLASAVFYSIILFQSKKEFNLTGDDDSI